MIVYVLLVLTISGWAAAYVQRRVRQEIEKAKNAAEAQASDWEQIAGQVARDTLMAKQYARVAMPEDPPLPKGTFQYDDTGLVRTWVPAAE